MAQQLNQAARILQITTGKALHIGALDGLDLWRFDAAQQGAHFRAVCNCFTADQFPIFIFFRHFSAQVLFRPGIQDIFVLIQHFFHGHTWIIRPRFSQIIQYFFRR